MRVYLKMKLLSDAVFGNGVSVPGAEDISVLSDSEGFPYYKGGTFKGIFREELENLSVWDPELGISIPEKLGAPGDDTIADRKLRFCDFEISPKVKDRVLLSVLDPEEVLNAFTYLRTFTALEGDTGVAKEGSLRICRCIRKGITFYGGIEYKDENDLPWIEETLGLIKWIGTLRNRGFGSVKIETMNAEEAE